MGLVGPLFLGYSIPKFYLVHFTTTKIKIDNLSYGAKATGGKLVTIGASR